MSHSLQGHCGAQAALHRPHPALVQEVARERGQRGRGRAAGRRAQWHGHVGRLGERLHVEDEGRAEVKWELLIPADGLIKKHINSLIDLFCYEENTP